MRARPGTTITHAGRRVRGAAFAAACGAVAAAAMVSAAPAGAASLPARLAPLSPFPRVIACELTRETVAPGIERAGYRLLTAAGPLQVALLVVDPANRWVRFDTVLAHDTVGGELETVSAMALRTGAVGGINGDYYAVGADRAPLGLVVRDGNVVHSGAARPAFAIGRDGVARIGSFAARGALSGIATAIGGGPILLRNGAAVDDSSSTNVADRAMRIPASVLVRFPSHRIGFVVVDGRAPARSVGVDRAELVALLRAMGALDALMLDSGGSATLVARAPGDEHASLANVPSDGVERPVADGFFVYSDAPVGPPAALVVRPARITALPGVRVQLSSRVVDAAGHALGDAQGAWAGRVGDLAQVDAEGVLHAGSTTGSGILHVARGGVRADVPVRVVERVARLSIGMANAIAMPGHMVELTLSAWDAGDARVAVGDRVSWSARNASVDRNGRLIVANRDAIVTANVRGATVSTRIPVGWHVVPFPVAGGSGQPAWRYVTSPPGGLGGAEPLADGVRIRYDFSSGGRAAYARAASPRLAGALLAVACDVTGDGNGEALRFAFSDRFGARESLTLAPAIDFTGARRLSIGGVVGLVPPLALRDVYVVGTLAHPAIRAAGSVGVEHCTASIAGA